MSIFGPACCQIVKTKDELFSSATIMLTMGICDIWVVLP